MIATAEDFNWITNPLTLQVLDQLAETVPAEEPTMSPTVQSPVVDFVKFPKIPRCANVRIVVTEKLDGTNAQVIIPEDPQAPIRVGSRNRWITPGKGTDNFGFAGWAYDNAEALRRLGPGRHYGEWYGQGIGRNYGLVERRWALFNIDRDFPEGLPTNVEKVPLLYIRQMSSLVEEQEIPESLVQVVDNLRTRGSRAVPGFMRPEGVVININHNLYKYVFDKAGPSPEEI